MGKPSVLQRILRLFQRGTRHVAPEVEESEAIVPTHIEAPLDVQRGFDFQAILDEVLSLGMWNGASAGKDYEILCRRFGLVSGRVETLEAVGTDLGLSRERVRQIQQRALSTIRRRIHSVEQHRSFIDLVQQKMTERGGAIAKDDLLDMVGHGGSGIRYTLDMGLAFILWLSEFVIDPPNKAADHWIVYRSESHRQRLDMATKSIHELLRMQGPSQRDSLIREFESNDVQAAVIGASLEVDQATIERDGYVWLMDPPKWHFVLSSLRRIGRPAHFSEVAREVNGQLTSKQRMTERAVHAVLGNKEPRVFRRVGLGTFGLAEWGLPAAKDSVDLVCQILEDELNWLTFQEIAVKASALGWQAKPESIRIALEAEDRKPTRRVRSIGSDSLARFGLSWWNNP